MKSSSHSHRSNQLACGSFAPPCIFKPFVTLLFALAVAVPTVSAGEPLPPGVMKISECPEEIKTVTDAPDTKVLKANETASYTEWESLGMASWNEIFWDAQKRYFGETGENHFKVSKRTNIDNPELIQVKLEGVFGGVDFIIDGNTRTHECSAVRQPTNYDCSVDKFGPSAELTTLEAFIIKDSSSSYGDVSCFSLAGGRFDIHIGFYISDTSYVRPVGIALLTFDNAPQFSYKVEGRHMYGKDEATATIELNPTGAVKQFKYLLSYNYNSGYSVPTIYKDHADELQTATTSITVPLETGCRVLHILPCDADGNWLGFEEYGNWIMDNRSFVIQSNRGDNHEWIPYGSVTIHEGVCRDNYYANVNGAPETFVCEALTRKDAPGKFLRIVNPYSPQSPVGSVVLANGDSRYELTDEDFYIDINLEDRDKPYLYNRPVGLEIFSAIEKEAGNDGWIPIGTEVYPAHDQILNGVTPDNVNYATNKWNRLTFGKYRSLEIELGENNLKCINISDDMTVTLEADNSVEYIKYAFINEENGMEIADKIAAGDASLTVYTAYIDKGMTRSAGHNISINIPSNIIFQTSRLIAVPYTAQGELSGTYLDTYLWHSIGNAKLTGSFIDPLELKPSVPVQQLGSLMTFRLVNPSDNWKASKYIYIDATYPDWVNISSDGEKGSIHTGVYLDGCSQRYDVYFGTSYNLVCGYTMPTLNGRTITATQGTMLYVVTNAENNRKTEYSLEGTIALPEWNKTSGVETVTTDEADADAPVEYYNLQGVKIINPGPGLYIRRQGSKASKVLIR